MEGFTNFGILGLMIIVFWLFFFRPQAKKQKAQAKFIDEIQKGDEVITSSGMIGRINKIDGNVVTLEVGNKTFIRVIRGSVSKEMSDSISAENDQKS